jgi:hypothetical protein
VLDYARFGGNEMARHGVGKRHLLCAVDAHRVLVREDCIVYCYDLITREYEEFVSSGPDCALGHCTGQIESLGWAACVSPSLDENELLLYDCAQHPPVQRRIRPTGLVTRHPRSLCPIPGETLTDTVIFSTDARKNRFIATKNWILWDLRGRTSHCSMRRCRIQSLKNGYFVCLSPREENIWILRVKNRCVSKFRRLVTPESIKDMPYLEFAYNSEKQHLTGVQYTGLIFMWDLSHDSFPCRIFGINFDSVFLLTENEVPERDGQCVFPSDPQFLSDGRLLCVATSVFCEHHLIVLDFGPTPSVTSIYHGNISNFVILENNCVVVDGGAELIIFE